MDEPLLYMTILAPLLALASWILEWTLAPLIAAARCNVTQRRFLLTDLLWLVVQLQLAMAIVAWAYPPNSTDTSRIWGVVALALPVTAFWFASLQAVSQAGILRPLQRAAVFIVVLPGAIAAILAVPAFLGMLVVAVLRELIASPESESDAGVVAMELIAAVAAMLVARRVASWTVAVQCYPLRCRSAS